MQLQTDKEMQGNTATTTMPPGLTDLPEELLELVISFLDGVSTLHIASSCSRLHRIATQERVWQSLRKRSNLVIMIDFFHRVIFAIFVIFLTHLCIQVTVSREARGEVERRRKSLDMKESLDMKKNLDMKKSLDMKETPIDTLRNSYFLCAALRENWGSGLSKENLLWAEWSGLELGYRASPCIAKASASTVAVVCDAKNEEGHRSVNLSELSPATLRLWDLGTNSRTSSEIYYKSLSY